MTNHLLRKGLPLKSFLLAIAGFGLALFIYSCQAKPPENSKAAQAARGEALFNKHCKVCHGDHGDGPMAETLKTPPADLTTIMERRRAKTFPIAEIARYIDGTKDLKSHGTREMPVWGEVFANEEKLGEKEIKGKYGELIAYLMTIQE